GQPTRRPAGGGRLRPHAEGPAAARLTARRPAACCDTTLTWYGRTVHGFDPMHSADTPCQRGNRVTGGTTARAGAQDGATRRHGRDATRARRSCGVGSGRGDHTRL